MSIVTTVTIIVALLTSAPGRTTLAGAAPDDGTPAGPVELAPGSDTTVRLRYTNSGSGPVDLRLAPAAARGSVCRDLPGGGLVLDVGTGPVDYCDLAESATGERRGQGPLVAADVRPATTIDIELRLGLDADASSPRERTRYREVLVIRAQDRTAPGAVALSETPLPIVLGAD